MTRLRMRHLIIIGTVFLAAVAAGIYLLAIRPKIADEPGEAASFYVLALMKNRAELAKSLSAPELWPQIDSWMGEHEPVDCPEAVANGWGVGGPRLDSGKVVYTYSFDGPCPDIENWYSLRIEDMVLKRTEVGWLIVNPGQIREQWGNFFDLDL